ncbi:hypothetical protein DAA51_37885 [Bradyrhizobium sp. WBAH10]|nr:hypothetical protein [Bradyrhizobium sp. WBAH30]MDD1546334.1 hypothetical protein [Bradyrhizobium sp. WBAH41]MDD1560498.1 hypothetical protein [Bradyrhizobium sp. WBAH23]MDD1567340.1 hypothetical protein [Bradyrhizobium sp. WBAH33]MDD1594151.1 hypothetical protein [Bradyrhizobium sp. WBAH42]NRB90825.1 hypothetical protein [Bradyrhizobium sp. WBAH10]QCJ93515.1 hypothetical protein DAA57_37575 [Bradyrhizobium yuanmingense]
MTITRQASPSVVCDVDAKRLIGCYRTRSAADVELEYEKAADNFRLFSVAFPLVCLATRNVESPT